MTVEDFYENLKDAFDAKVFICKDGILLWSGFMKECPVDKNIMQHEVKNVYPRLDGIGINII